MVIITDTNQTQKYLDQVLEAFTEQPDYRLKVVRWSDKYNKDTIDTYLKKIKEEVVIIISSSMIRAYSGIRPNEWDIQPVKSDKTLYLVPSLGFIIRRGGYLNLFAKLLSAAMYIEKGGTDIVVTKEILIKDLDTFDKCMRHIKQTGLACFDFETYSDEHKDYEWFREDFHASLLAISPQPGVSYTIPFDHKENPIFPEDMEIIKQRLNNEMFNNPEIRKIGWNVKYDMNVACKIGMQLSGRYDDAMVMLAILDNTRSNYKLKDTAAEFFPETLGYDDEVHGYEWKNVPLKILSKYAAIDSSLTMLLCAMFEARLDDRLMNLYRNLVAPATKVLQKMEYRGMVIDLDVVEEGIEYAKELEERLDKELREIPQVIRFEKIMRQETIDDIVNKEQAKIDNWQSVERTTDHYEKRAKEKIRSIKTGETVVFDQINFASYKQLKELLYREDGFGFKSLKKNTAESTLNEIQDNTGFIEKLLLSRKVAKNKSTYLESIKDKTVNGRLHTTFTQHVTDTGRLSSRNPNLQNLPNEYRVKDPEIAKLVHFIKKAFVPPEDHFIVQADLSQAELRFMAEFSQDETMVQAYRDGKDLHAIGAAANLHISLEEFYKLPEDEQKDHRFRAKARNFGLIYLMSPQGYRDYAKNNYGIELSESEAFKEHDGFFRLYPGVRRYHKIYEAKAKKFGKVRNWFGRQRWLPNINDENDFKASIDLRAGINMPIQGTCGDYTTMSLVFLDFRLGSDIELVNSIHDSVIPYIHKNKMKKVLPVISETLNNLPCEKYFGRKWKTMKMESDIEGSEKSWADMEEIC